MDRVFFALGCVLAALGVGLGAFGAHALRGRISEQALATWETASRYHLVHALGLLVVAWAVSRWPGGLAVLAGWLLLAGIVLFSGSLYLLAATGFRALGAVTPVGGVAFIAAWILLALQVVRSSG